MRTQRNSWHGAEEDMARRFGGVRDLIGTTAPEEPVYCLRPQVTERNLREFVRSFPGTVLYAVKCNPAPRVLELIHAAGVRDFDTASLSEIALVSRRHPDARCHFMHPVKGRAALRAAWGRHGVRHFVVDHADELAKLFEEIPARDLVLSVRLRTPPAASTVYDLSTKFGCGVEEAVALLRAIDAAGCRGGLAFHVGSQCGDPGAWGAALALAGEVLARAGVAPAVVDVGGGFPVRYPGLEPPPLAACMEIIRAGVARLALPPDTAVLAEPGRALVAEACSLLVRVMLRKDGALYLNDGVFGSLAEMALSSLRMPPRLWRRDGEAAPALRPYTLYGPTCDGLDVLPGSFELPVDAREGDWLEFAQLGAYSNALATRFNGFFPRTWVELEE